MKSKIVFSSLLILVAVFISSCSPKPSPQQSNQTLLKTNISSANCGPKVLLEVLKIYGIPATEEELVRLSDTQNGESSFYGLSKAVESKGLKCLGAKVSFDKLKTLAKDNQIIVHYSQNHHFVLIKQITDKAVSIYDPGLIAIAGPQIPIHLFLSDWDGNVLIINKELKV